MPPLKPQLPLTKGDLKVIGDSGTRRYSGYFSEEPSFEWRDELRIDNVETMRRTDATVKQLLEALNAPMLATEYDIQPGGDDPKYIEHCEFAEENLFNMRRTWKEFMREALTYLPFGFSTFEQIYTKKNSKIYLADLEPRIQHSILKWQLNDGRRGIVQQIHTDEVDIGQNQAQIPMNKLLVFTNDKEGDDYTGQSVLRPCWKHFYLKDKMYRIESISTERYGVGVPLITLPEEANEQQKADAEEMAANIRSNEKGYIILPSKDWVVDILVPKGNPQKDQIANAIAHHDRMILTSALAGFLNLGADSAGSYALSKDQSSFFLKHVEDKLMYMVEQINKQVIQRLIIINFGEQEKYPRLTFTPLGDIDFGEYSTTLKTLKDAGFISKITAEDEQFARKTFKMRPLTEDEIEQIETDKIVSDVDGLEKDLPVAEESKAIADEGEDVEDEDIPQ